MVYLCLPYLDSSTNQSRQSRKKKSRLSVTDTDIFFFWSWQVAQVVHRLRATRAENESTKEKEKGRQVRWVEQSTDWCGIEGVVASGAVNSLIWAHQRWSEVYRFDFRVSVSNGPWLPAATMVCAHPWEPSPPTWLSSDINKRPHRHTLETEADGRFLLLSKLPCR